MNKDNYKLKYIKYKKKYLELKKIQNNINNVESRIIILPNEYGMLDINKQMNFEVYEVDNMLKPISYIKKQYKNNENIDEINNKEYVIMKKQIITPDEYYLLSDSNKSKYEINESDYDKFPNRVVPKNYIKIH